MKPVHWRCRHGIGSSPRYAPERRRAEVSALATQESPRCRSSPAKGHAGRSAGRRRNFYHWCAPIYLCPVWGRLRLAARPWLYRDRWDVRAASLAPRGPGSAYVNASLNSTIIGVIYMIDRRRSSPYDSCGVVSLLLSVTWGWFWTLAMPLCGKARTASPSPPTSSVISPRIRRGYWENWASQSTTRRPSAFPTALPPVPVERQPVWPGATAKLAGSDRCGWRFYWVSYSLTVPVLVYCGTVMRQAVRAPLLQQSHAIVSKLSDRTIED